MSSRFLGHTEAKRIHAIECAWLERVRRCQLYCYHMPAATFECLDECAGYFVSRAPVVPARVDVIDLLGALGPTARNAVPALLGELSLCLFLLFRGVNLEKYRARLALQTA